MKTDRTAIVSTASLIIHVICWYAEKIIEAINNKKNVTETI
jgi:hypothetical protein